MRISIGVLMIFALSLCGCRTQADFPAKVAVTAFQTELDKLAPVALDCDLTSLSPADRMALGEIIRAAKVMDQLFLRQVHPDNPALLKKLEADKSPENFYLGVPSRVGPGTGSTMTPPG